MIQTEMAMMMAVAALLVGCAQNTPPTYTGGPPDPNSMTTFTLSLTSGSIVNCLQVEAGMDRPMTMTVRNNSGELLTAGGIHYGLTRVAPNVYAGGDWIKIRATLATTPKTLMVRTDDSRCVWTASAP